MRDTLLVFKQFRFKVSKNCDDGHVIGNCIFCGRQDHFFINALSKNLKWDCKKCGRSGGYMRFLEEVVRFGNESLSGKFLKKLSTDRGISQEVLKESMAGYIPSSDLFTLPVFSESGKELLNVKIFDLRNHSFKNCAGCYSSMYGLWAIPESYETIYVAEGEWDTLAMREILSKTSKGRGSAVIGVPGASTFKPEAVKYFVGKRVVLLYDNDESGENGAKKAVKMISPVTGNIQKLSWPNNYSVGHDVRDLYIKDFDKKASATFKFIEGNLEVEEPVEGDRVQAGTVEDFDGPRVSASEVYQTFKKYLYLPDLRLLDVIFGTIIANRLPGDPVWMFLVAPPGFTKTEPLLTLTGGKMIETLSSLTPSTLISGCNMGGSDPSLIPQLDKKVLIIKDFTSILGLPCSERDEIFTILRDAFDGECSKPFGNGIFRRYKSKFGILAAVTPMIEMFVEEQAALGERFLRWRQREPACLNERKKYINKALSNITKEVAMRLEMADVAKRVLLHNYKDVPKVPDEIYQRVIGLAQWICLLQSKVHRDRYTREIQHKSFVALGTREGKELMKLMMGIAQFRNTDVDEYCYDVARSVALSSVSARYVETIRKAWNLEESEFQMASLLDKNGLPQSTVDTVLHNLVMVGVMSKKKVGHASFWKIKKQVVELITRCKLFEERKEVDETQEIGKKVELRIKKPKVKLSIKRT